MKRFPNVIIILKTYLLVLAVFFVFRLILFITEFARIESFSTQFYTIVRAFIMGVRFDTVISGYILLLPFLVISILTILNKQYKWIYRLFFWWIFILFSLAFLVCAADIPYFNQFFSRFSVEAFQWFNNPGFVFKMIFEEPRYFIILIPLILFIFIFYKILKKIFIIPENQSVNSSIIIKIMITLAGISLIFIGIRGRLEEKSPIKVGTAYFCDDPFLNQLGLNPVFTLLRSYLDSIDERNRTIRLMDDNVAIENVRKYLGITKPIDDYPLARQVYSDTATSVHHYNVILVIMESMSAAKMTRYGNRKNLTPFLDSIAAQGYCFDDIYTAGLHTYNGVFSTLFSFPGIYRQHPMKESAMFHYNGIGYTLKHNGYSTTYFTTHDGQFDNIEGFLRENDFDNIVSLKDYPPGIAKTTLGVPDDFMFEFSMPVIDKLHQEGKPFFVTFMTASDHGPYYLPDYYKPRNSNIKDQMVEYADWSLRKLVTLASKKDWFDSTLFVFVADHGAPINVVYDIPLDYHHSPLIYYAPGIIQPKDFSCIGGQIDVYPTIMGILNQPYINNTEGIDLLSESRPYIFINHDDRFGVIGPEFFLVLRKHEKSSLYKYRNRDRKDYIGEYPAKVQDMEEYALSNIQVFQYLTLSDKRFIDW